MPTPSFNVTGFQTTNTVNVAIEQKVGVSCTAYASAAGLDETVITCQTMVKYRVVCMICGGMASHCMICTMSIITQTAAFLKVMV